MARKEERRGNKRSVLEAVLMTQGGFPHSWGLLIDRSDQIPQSVGPDGKSRNLFNMQLFSIRSTSLLQHKRKFPNSSPSTCKNDFSSNESKRAPRSARNLLFPLFFSFLRLLKHFIYRAATNFIIAVFIFTKSQTSVRRWAQEGFHNRTVRPRWWKHTPSKSVIQEVRGGNELSTSHLGKWILTRFFSTIRRWGTGY